MTAGRRRHVPTRLSSAIPWFARMLPLCAAALAEEGPQVVGLTSAFFVGGAGAAFGFECTISAHREPLEITHAFGGGSGGEVWQQSSVLVVLSPSQGRAASLALAVEEHRAGFHLQRGRLHVGALRGPLEVPMHREAHGSQPGCPPAHCLAPAPDFLGHAVSRPRCGWAQPVDAIAFRDEVSGNKTATLEVDVTPLLALPNISALQIWAAPQSAAPSGMWQTPIFFVRSARLLDLPRETVV